MPIYLFLVILTFVRADPGQAQQAGGGEIRGSIVDRASQPVAHAEVQAREQKGKTFVQLATAAPDGSYRLGDLPPGTYIVRISATGFDSTEIRDVQIQRSGVKVMPAVRVEAGLIGDCGIGRRPNYCRLRGEVAEGGTVGGVVTSDDGRLVAGANVTLYMQGEGPVSSQATRDDGTFSFAGLRAGSEEYRVSIAREGYFSEEVRHLDVLPGFETVYLPITMESCSPGHCQPHLRTIHLIGPCA